MASKKSTRYLILVILFLFPLFMMGQDVVTLKDGSSIICQVLEVGDNQIAFKQSGSSETLLLTVKDIDFITYANGEKETFGNSRSQKTKKNVTQNAPITSEPYPVTDNSATISNNVNQIEDNPVDRGYWQLFYCSSFKNKDHGIWGAGWRVSFEGSNGWGFNWQMYTNLFLKRKGEDFGLNFAIGPDYTLKLTDDANVCLILPVLACATSYEDFDGDGKKKTKYAFGVTSTPSFILAKFIRLGYQVTYMRDNWSKSFFIGLTF